MSEHKPHHEGHEHHENLHENGEHLARVEKDLLQKAELAQNEKANESLSHISEKAESHAESSANIQIDKHANEEPDAVLGVQQTLKSDAYRHTLRTVQRKLPKPARAFSKIAHNNVVESVSEVSAKTVARPSGVLGGSIFSFAGTLVLLYYSRHYGFTYNYALVFILFVLGFLIGIAAELAVWTLYSRKHPQH